MERKSCSATVNPHADDRLQHLRIFLGTTQISVLILPRSALPELTCSVTSIQNPWRDQSDVKQRVQWALLVAFFLLSFYLGAKVDRIFR